MYGLDFWSGLVEPRAKTEDLRRREFIANILLVAAIVLAFFAVIDNQMSWFFDRANYFGPPAYLMPWVFLAFLFLFLLSRMGFFVEVAYFLIAGARLCRRSL